MAVDVATFLISPLDDNSLMMISVTLAEVAGGFMAFGQASLSVPPQVFKSPLKHPCSKKTFLGKVAGVCSHSKGGEKSLLSVVCHHSRPYHTVWSLTTCKYAPISFGFTIHGIPIETYVRVIDVLWSSRQIKLQPTRQELYRPQAHGVASGLEPASHPRWTQQHVKQLELA